MKYAPTLWDFQTGFFLLERAKEPYFLVSQTGELLRANRVGDRFLARLKRTKPQLLNTLMRDLNEGISGSTKKVVTLLLGENRKRVLRAVPVDAGRGFLLEIDRV